MTVVKPEPLPLMVGQLVAEIAQIRECVGAIIQQKDAPGLQLIGLMRGEFLAQRAAFAATLAESRTAWFLDRAPQRASLVRPLIEARARTALVLAEMMIASLEAPKGSHSAPEFTLAATN